MKIKSDIDKDHTKFDNCLANLFRLMTRERVKEMTPTTYAKKRHRLFQRDSNKYSELTKAEKLAINSKLLSGKGRLFHLFLSYEYDDFGHLTEKYVIIK